MKQKRLAKQMWGRVIAVIYSSAKPLCAPNDLPYPIQTRHTYGGVGGELLWKDERNTRQVYPGLGGLDRSDLVTSDKQMKIF